MKSFSLQHQLLAIGLLVIAALTVFSISSCSKKAASEDANAKYYVKYIINGNGAYGRFSDWTATTPQAKYTNTGYQTRSWTQTYGPVIKGFKCEVLIENYIGGAPTIEIHVSKNDEAFTLKVTVTGSSASYIVDF